MTHVSHMKLLGMLILPLIILRVTIWVIIWTYGEMHELLNQISYGYGNYIQISYLIIILLGTQKLLLWSLQKYLMENTMISNA